MFSSIIIVITYSFSLEKRSPIESDSLVGSATKGEANFGVMDDMYGQRKKLETVFYSFDTDGDGVISLDEFREGCEVLNKSLHPDCQLTNIDHTLQMMDFGGTGAVNINEFFETFRILDAKDGKVDGVISLAKGARPSNFNRKAMTGTAKKELLK
jgi:hypothetical protein